MKNTLCLFIIVLSLIQCKSQEVSTYVDGSSDDIIRVFLNQMKPYIYLNRNISGKERIDYFKGKYSLHQEMFKTSDSVCKNSKDIDQRKFYCPLADSFRVYDTLLSMKELDFLIIEYVNDSKEHFLDVDILMQDIPLQKHSDEYYEQLSNDVYSVTPSLSEFPSVRIENLYFNTNKDVVIVAYTVVSSPTQADLNFYLMKKMNGLWWKPIGAFRI